jgi:hypothetical protein
MIGFLTLLAKRERYSDDFSKGVTQQLFTLDCVVVLCGWPPCQLTTEGNTAVDFTSVMDLIRRNQSCTSCSRLESALQVSYLL